METLSTETPALFAAAVSRAAAALRAGEVVALPTETVYGLAANAFNAMAVQTIFRVKNRPSQNPIIVHVSSLEMAQQCVLEWPGPAQQMADAFWPGPLTLVLRKSPRIPDNVTAGGRTVGIRWPSHPLMQAVIRACGFPLAAPSANLSNRLSPTTAEHVRRGLADKVSLLVDGGYCHVGIESTVVDLASDPPRILRPGIIHAESVRAVIGDVKGGAPATAAASEELRSPGQLPKHYSPQAQLRVWEW
ncbi:MAG TPA: L-threonylcarbamoyladenylate synthase, partial [Verrucomicrobiae bacterium]|nr:L-threonylcarbamoyladenylate synthase [Verrucomicrobiae bacterium]